MHRLPDDLLITPALLHRFDAEAEQEVGVNLGYWALIERSNGDFNTHGQGLEPLAEQKMIAFDLLPRLNRELHHDGAWVFLWTDPKQPDLAVLAGTEYQRFVLLWLDKDGDVAFPVEVEDRLEVVLQAGLLHWMEQAEQAWRIWKTMMVEALAPKPEQQFKKAQGQAAPTANAPSTATIQ